MVELQHIAGIIIYVALSKQKLTGPAVLPEIDKIGKHISAKDGKLKGTQMYGVGCVRTF